MRPHSSSSDHPDRSRRSDFIDSLSSFSRHHRAQRWEGTFGEFLEQMLPRQPGRDGALESRIHLGHAPLAWAWRPTCDVPEAAKPRELFRRDLFGIDEPLTRLVEYFKAAAAGSDVGRRLLLLLGPPSGGKSTVAILLKRGLEEYSRTDEGALYAIKGSPLRENPLNLVPTSLRAQVPRDLRRRYQGRAVAVGAGLRGARVRKRTSCGCRSSACSSPKPRGRASAPMRRMTPPPRTSRTSSAPSTSRRWRRSAMKAIRAPGRGPAPCMPPAAACWR